MIKEERSPKSYSRECFEERKEEIREKGYFQCSNKELWNDLYEELKPEFPTLYKSRNHLWQYLHIIKPEQVDNIVYIVKEKQNLKKEIEEIDEVLKNLGLNPEDY